MKRKIGQTNVEVFPIGLGAMALSLEDRPPEAQAIRTLHAAFDAGIGFIDTADSYCIDNSDLGHNERLIRKALARWPGSPQEIRIATKGGVLRPRGDWITDARPRHLREACESSLRNLGVDRVFLYQLHAPDDQVPYEDSLGELVRLREEGKIAHIGISNVGREELERALIVAGRIESVQNRCNPFEQDDLKNGLVRRCQELGITYIAYAPMGGHRGNRRLPASEPFARLATRYGASAYQLALAWLLSRGANILPIPGARRPETVLDNTAAARLQLDPADALLIDRMSGWTGEPGLKTA
ncbi:MAG: aldo/keto reductase [Oligoflexia bacterium]|nr:aldo/keto reductase [Oligoflexia bacterium]